MVKELQAFIKELENRGIEWVDASDPIEGNYRVDRVHFHYNDKLISVVNGFGTYGGYRIDSEKNMGLLEAMIGYDEPVGYLSCQSAINLIFKEV